MKLAAPLVVLLGCGATPRAAATQDADLVVTGATVIDGTGAAPIRDATIVVRGGRIVALGHVPVPRATRVLDAHGRFVIPGLIDTHVHFGTGGIEPDDASTTERVLHQLLWYGVTTAFDVGGVGGGDDQLVALRRARSGGPRIFGTGALMSVPGSHPMGTIAADAVPDPATFDWSRRGYFVVTSEAQAIAEVDHKAALGLDGVKIIIESGPATFGKHPQMPPELAHTIVQEAERHGLHVFAHTSDATEMSEAIDAGVHAIMHAAAEEPFPDDALLARMRDRGVYLVPTLALYAGFHRYLDDPSLLADPFLRAGVAPRTLASLDDPGFRQHHAATARWMRDHMATIVERVAAAHRLGVRIALGTDCGNPFDFAGYAAHLELELLERAGLGPMEVLEAATRDAAAMIGHADELGTLEVGKRADFLVLAADPLADIRNTRTLETVVLGGQVVER